MHLICIDEFLDAEALSGLRMRLAALTWEDGRRTAGWAARDRKHNLQLDGSRAEVQALQCEVRERVASHALLRSFAWPRQVGLPLFSRYLPGMEYGRHVDDALMDAGRLRTDLAYTLFLAAPEDYDGGELVLESAAGEMPVKLAAGAIVVYEAGTLHRVAAVTRGERLAAVGWIQSQVRLARQREVLFDLERTRRALHEREGDSDAFATLSRCSGALLRMWAEP